MYQVTLRATMDAELRDWKSALDGLWSADDLLAGKRCSCGRKSCGTAPSRRCNERPRKPRQAYATFALRRLAVGRNTSRKCALRHSVMPCMCSRPRAWASVEYVATSAGGVSTTHDRHRLLLGLPLGRRLYGPEISQAYKHAAKKIHPLYVPAF
jgi:hypothetical protein